MQITPFFNNLVLSNGSKNLQNVIQIELKWIYFAKKSQKLHSLLSEGPMQQAIAAVY